MYYISFQHVIHNVKNRATIWKDLLQTGCGGKIFGEPFSTVHRALIADTTINRDKEEKRGGLKERMLQYKYDCWRHFCKNHIITSLSVTLSKHHKMIQNQRTW